MRIPEDAVVVMTMEVQSFFFVPLELTDSLRRIHVHSNYRVRTIHLIASRQLVLNYRIFFLRIDRESALRQLLCIHESQVHEGNDTFILVVISKL